MSRFAIVVALVCLTAGSASAQRPQTRAGFWIGGGLGYGSFDLGCDGCESDRESGVTALLAMGGTVSPSVLVGAELEGWGKEIDGVDLSFGHLSGVMYWYPKPAAGFFLKGGIGVARLAVDAGPLGDESDTGVGLHGGVGYDFRVGRTLSLTPAAGIFWASLDAENANVLHIGLSVTGH
ncbi:MAG: outer membrane beta-barrel protein [Gemmatimonadales bacterium]|nr:outer membrane beta-barrel protein [Gemmatimonadales bacterium]